MQIDNTVIRSLEKLQIENIVGDSMPPRAQNIHVGAMDFHFLNGSSIGIRGVALTVGHKQEVFYLQVGEASLSEWYQREMSTAPGVPRIIEPIDFLAMWREAGFADLIKGPRKLVFYRKGIAAQSESLQRVTAIELASLRSPQQTVVLRASDDFPTDIEIGDTCNEVQRLLRDLLPFTPSV